MLIEHQHPKNKSIFICVLGAPNVGKSSFINYFIGMDLSIVTHKPQTTRNKFQCITTIDHTEIILVDTPGLHRSNQEFNIRLNEQAISASQESELNFLLVDVSKEILPQIKEIADILGKGLKPSWLIFTKSDLVKEIQASSLKEIFERSQKIIPALQSYFMISMKTGDSVHLLTGSICDAAKSGPHYYNGEISNKNIRFFVMEYIREQAFLYLKEELPYQISVVIDEYKNTKTLKGTGKSSLAAHISASILVNRPSQRSIVVGSKGEMIKRIGVEARKKIESLLDGHVYLNLHVKVSPHWFKNNFILEEIGLPRAATSRRVWRKR